MASPQAQEDGRERRYVRALVLAYLASLNRSLFAAKCLVEVVVEMYQEGVTLEDAKLLLSLASLQQGGQLLGPMDEDILVNYVAVIMIALEMVGVPLKPQGEARMRELGRRNPADDEAGLIAGLRGMVRVGVDQFLAGTDLFRLQLQQSMAAKVEGEAGGFSPAIQMLQQNTRLVVITLEVVRGMGLPTSVPLQEPPGLAGEVQEVPGPAQVPQRHWVPGFLRACDPEAASGVSADEQQRAAAVRLLISFMGAAQGFLYSAWDFVQQAIECYSNGWSADDVYGCLQDEEFAQSGGMALQVARLPGTPNLTAAVFARFLSIVYMTLAQLGVVFPGAARQDGWAWVSGAAGMHGEEGEAGATSLEAYGLADFVLNTVRNEERKEREGRGADVSGPGSGVEAEGVLARPSPDQLQRQQREGFVSIEDPGLLASSPAVLVMSQQISLVQMARQLVLRERDQAAAPPVAG